MSSVFLILTMEIPKSLVVFQGKGIRRTWFNEEWWFSVVDIIGILSESADPRNYWKVLKHRLIEEGSEVVTDCNQLKLPAADGKYYDSDYATVKTLFRIIQAIPSPKENYLSEPQQKRKLELKKRDSI